jgi:inner membrane protein
MPTPVGHALAGLAISSARGASLRHHWPFAAAGVASALLPDIDFLFGFLAGRNLHHYFTHSLGATAIYGAAVYLFCRFAGRQDALRMSGWLTLAYASHLGLDLLSKDTAPPFGIQLFWPFAPDFYLSAVLVFDEVWRGSLAKLFGLHNWLAVAREAVLLAPLVGLVRWLALRGPGQTR